LLPKTPKPHNFKFNLPPVPLATLSLLKLAHLFVLRKASPLPIVVTRHFFGAIFRTLVAHQVFLKSLCDFNTFKPPSNTSALFRFFVLELSLELRQTVALS